MDILEGTLFFCPSSVLLLFPMYLWCFLVNLSVGGVGHG
jgi:hypothetical protein